jgi:hypothetical protein
MFEEPEVQKVFIEKVALLIPETKHNNLLQLTPNDDPVYHEIYNTSHLNLGLAGEEYAMRLFMRLADSKRSLFEVLKCEKSGIQLNSVSSYIRFAEILTCGTANELGVPELDFLLDPNIKYSPTLQFN